jgi:hypothetical protein
MKPTETTNDEQVAAPEQPTPQVVQQVQYVKMEQSLKGLGGMLVFWMVVFALSGIGSITSFFALMTSTGSVGAIAGLIFSPLIAAASIASVVLIALTKKIAIVTSVALFGLSALYSTIVALVNFANYGDSSGVPVLIGSLLTLWVVAGLFSLYFFLSKRVKETLIK